MMKLWNSIKKSSKKHNRINEFKDFDEFYNHWLKQKATYGMRCPATGVEMTHTIGTNKSSVGNKRIMTNISTDRDTIYRKLFTSKFNFYNLGIQLC
jgi:hypothetical protein